MQAMTLHNFAASRPRLPKAPANALSYLSQHHENTWLLVVKKFIEPAQGIK
jgi:hypothetical protein